MACKRGGTIAGQSFEGRGLKRAGGETDRREEGADDGSDDRVVLELLPCELAAGRERQEQVSVERPVGPLLLQP
jgi:hypothetical protein